MSLVTLKPYVSKKWLENQYTLLRKSTYKIAEKCGCNQTVIYNWLKRLDIPIRKQPESKRVLGCTLYRKEPWLRNQYLGFKKNTYQIAREGECSQTAIRYWLKKFFIPIRTSSEALKGRKAWNKGKKRPPISEEWRRHLSESKRGKRMGAENPSWKGGKGTLKVQIRRHFKYRQWRSDIFTRDDFTCQECGRRGGTLNAHHAPDSFAFILEINDITTLEQALNCEELWNINNGRTLCERCHNKTKGVRRESRKSCGS